MWFENWNFNKQMTKLNQIYKCNICGNIVEVVHAGTGELTCCNQAMQLMEENTQDAAREKHVPVIKKTDSGIKVKVGAVPHPMDRDHFIEWIEIIIDGKLCKHFLKPGDAPETEFKATGDNIIARAYCNLHGLWKNY